MKLFFGMILYFFLVSRIVIGSNAEIREWELQRKARQRLSVAVNGNDVTEKTQESVPSETSDKKGAKERRRLYYKWRTFFVDKVCNKIAKDPQLFTELLEELEIEEEVMRDPSAREAKIHFVLEERFSFAAYLALNVERGVSDCIQLHVGTWLVLIACFCVFALWTRLCKKPIIWLIFAAAPISFFIIIILLCTARKRRRTIERHGETKLRTSRTLASIDMAKSQSDHSNETHADLGISSLETVSAILYRQKEDAFDAALQKKLSPETVMLRILQVFLALNSYSLSRAIFSFDDWRHNFLFNLVTVSAYIFLFVLLAYFLPSSVPRFLASMAMPPYVDERNIHAMVALLIDDQEHDVIPSPIKLAKAKTEQDVDSILRLLSPKSMILKSMSFAGDPCTSRGVTKISLTSDTSGSSTSMYTSITPKGDMINRSVATFKNTAIALRTSPTSKRLEDTEEIWVGVYALAEHYGVKAQLKARLMEHEACINSPANSGESRELTLHGETLEAGVSSIPENSHLETILSI